MENKKLTRTQEMINFVWNNGPSTWTEIQRYMVGWDGTDQELCKSGARGYGAMSFWKTARQPARNRQYYITKPKGHLIDFAPSNKYYVVIDATTNQIHVKDKHKHLIANTANPMFQPN